MEYVPRLVDELLRKRVRTFPAVLVVGPRAVGKTTSARRIVRSVARLDVPREAAAFEADADVALASFEEPVLLDEWQVVPEVLGAVKRAVDEDPRPGRFVLTGSVRADLDARAWPGTGRLVRVSLEPMVLSERMRADLGAARSRIDRLFDEGAGWLTGRRCSLGLDDHLEAALAGGWPQLLGLEHQDRVAWLASYVDQLITRDAQLVDGGRDPDRLRAWLRAYAATVATVTDDRSIYTSAGVAKATGESYGRLMEALLIARPLPAWWTNELKRLARRPKRHLVDAALLSVLLGMDARGALRTGSHGQILEAFVASQIRALLATTREPTRAFHLRHLDGHEIDVVLERADRRLVAIEVKATAAPRHDDVVHLRWLREVWGDRVAATLLAHTGPAAFDMGGGVIATPLGVLLGL
ncbi:MAG: ATP-binding protein [Nitriliruptorales bacterium]